MSYYVPWISTNSCDVVDGCEILHHQKDGWNPKQIMGWNNGMNKPPFSTGAGFCNHPSSSIPVSSCWYPMEPCPSAESLLTSMALAKSNISSARANHGKASSRKKNKKHMVLVDFPTKLDNFWCKCWYILHIPYMEHIRVIWDIRPPISMILWKKHEHPLVVHPDGVEPLKNKMKSRAPRLLTPKMQKWNQGSSTPHVAQRENHQSSNWGVCKNKIKRFQK